MAEYAIVLCFDTTTEAKLRRLQSCFRRPEGLYSRPHVTLAVSSTELLHEFKVSLGECFRNVDCIEVELSSVSMRPADDNDIFLGLDNSPILRNLHLKIMTILGSNFGTFRSYHLPNKWNPHCTVAYSLDDSELPMAVQLCRKSDIFGKARLVQAVVLGARGEEISIFGLNPSS